MTQGDWDVPGTTLTQPPFAGPNDPSIVIFPDPIPAAVIALMTGGLIPGNGAATVVAAVLYQTGAGEYYFDAISVGGAGQCMARGRVASSNSTILHYNIDQGASTFLTDVTGPDMTTVNTITIGDVNNGGQLALQSPFGGPAFASASLTIPNSAFNFFQLLNNAASVGGQNSVLLETSGLANGTPAVIVVSDGSVSVSSSTTIKSGVILAPQVGGQGLWAQDRGAASPGTEIPRGVRGVAFSTSNSAAFNAETVSLTLANQVYRDGRAYRFDYGRQISASLSTNVGSFTVRKTNATGTIWGQAGSHGPSGAAPGINAEGYFIVARAVGAGDLTATTVLTLTPNAGTVTHLGSTQSPREFIVSDIGATGDYPNAFIVT